MNSRDRIHAVFKRKKCDRIPMDMGGTRKTGISVTALYHLRQCIGSEKAARLYDVYSGTAELDDIIEKTLGCDVLRIPQPVPLLNIECLREQTKKWWKPYAMEDGTGVLIPKDFYPERDLSGDLCLRDFQDRRYAIQKRGGWHYDLYAEGPGALGMTVEEVTQALNSPNPAVISLPDSSYWSLLTSFVKAFSRSSKKAFSYRITPPLAFFGGLGNREPLKWLDYLESRPEEAEKLLEMYFSLWVTQMETLFATVGDALDVLILEENFVGVSQDDALNLILKRIMPFYARGIREIREHFGSTAEILWQAEGNSTPFLPSLIEMGVQGISFTDLETSGMNPLSIKKDFGNELVLWGGACSATDLAEKKPDDVLKKLQENVEILAENGGYVHAVAGNIAPETDPEVILTYFAPRE